MRMPFAPFAVMSSSAATWLALSTSLFPAAVSSLTFSSPAVSSATLRIVTQNGFVSCLVIRPTVTCSPPLAPPHGSHADGESSDGAAERDEVS